MLNQLSQMINRFSKTWLVLVSLFIFLYFIISILPAQSAKASSNTGSVSSPDTSFFYSTRDLYQMADSYGVDGRAAYIRARFSFDLIWPLVYTLFLLTGISWLTQRVLSPASPFQIINLFPFLAIIFDLFENLSTSFVMARYPTLSPLIGFLSPLFSGLKWIFVSTNFLLLLILCALYLKKKFFSKQK
ncbi:MAG: hypothetical protein CVU46_18615 [Chloroflexi bacterium HGW-Chloroflexi-8]|nr:MAG: hypothetical protein CVU46_18615 [Chloroflexi bacterium HGW-Chloroflexi-8]